MRALVKAPARTHLLHKLRVHGLHGIEDVQQQHSLPRTRKVMGATIGHERGARYEGQAGTLDNLGSFCFALVPSGR